MGSQSDFSIIEWLTCSKCDFLCDAPFQPEGSSGSGPEIWLGHSLPDSEWVPDGEWSVAVSADCPQCKKEISAVAKFESRVLREFRELST